MRAKELPARLFEELIQITEGEVTEFVYGSEKCRAIFLKDEQAVIGLSGSGRSDSGQFTSVRLWKCFWFGQGFKPENLESPIVSITGGPFRDGVWAFGSGERLTERVKIEFGYESYRVGIPLNSPIAKLVAILIMRAIQLAENEKVADLRYWQSFLNPNANYKKP